MKPMNSTHSTNKNAPSKVQFTSPMFSGILYAAILACDWRASSLSSASIWQYAGGSASLVQLTRAWFSRSCRRVYCRQKIRYSGLVLWRYTRSAVWTPSLSCKLLGFQRRDKRKNASYDWGELSMRCIRGDRRG